MAYKLDKLHFGSVDDGLPWPFTYRDRDGDIIFRVTEVGDVYQLGDSDITGDMHIGGDTDISGDLDVTGGLTVDGVTVDASTTALSGLTASAAELNKTDGVPATSYLTVMSEMSFTETTGDGIYTGTIALPAGSRIIDIGVDGQVLWNSGTSASLIVGDGVDPDGFFTATDLKAVDLLAGEINNIEHPGGKAGAYIAAEQRNLYQSTSRNIVAVLTKVGTGTAGRTRVYVVYAVPTAVAVSKV